MQPTTLCFAFRALQLPNPYGVGGQGCTSSHLPPAQQTACNSTPLWAPPTAPPQPAAEVGRRTRHTQQEAGGWLASASRSLLVIPLRWQQVSVITARPNYSGQQRGTACMQKENGEGTVQNRCARSPAARAEAASSAHPASPWRTTTLLHQIFHVTASHTDSLAFAH